MKKVISKLKEMIDDASIVKNGETCVYRLINNNNDVIYVGQTKTLERRIKYHIFNGVDFSKFTYQVCDPKDANDLEAEGIVKFKTKINKELPKNSLYQPISNYNRSIRTAIKEKINEILLGIELSPEIVFSTNNDNFKRQYVCKKQMESHIEKIKTIKLTIGENND